MNRHSLIGNVSVAFIAQGTSLLLGLIQSLLVPKLLGVEQYGYWQLFVFYASYVGFFHLGLNDGVYLVMGGMSRKEIDKGSVSSQFLVEVAFQTMVGLVVVFGAALGGSGFDREFVIACTGVFLVTQNLASYLMYVLQAMNETRLSSYATIIERSSFLVSLLILLVMRFADFRPYVFAYMLANAMKLAYCLWHIRDFYFSGFLPPSAAIRESWASIRVGIKLMVANIASQLILGVARFAIDAEWGIEMFGELSLAFSLVSSFLAFVSQVSMVLFPALRQSDDDEMARFFVNARDLMSVLSPAVYALYFPLVHLLSLWLPQYTSGLIFLALLLPICAFDGKMDISCTTYFKVTRQEGLLFRINVVTCVMSALGALIGIRVFGSAYAIIAAATAAIIGRSLYSEYCIAGDLGLPSSTLSYGELAVTVVFVLASVLLPSYALPLYLAAYAVFMLTFKARVHELFVKVSQIGRVD